MSLPYSSSSPADSSEKREECRQAGEAIQRLLEMDLKPRDIMTKGAFENAIRMVMMTGGSTNAVLHLIAMSRSCQDPSVAISLNDFQRLSDQVRFLLLLLLFLLLSSLVSLLRECVFSCCGLVVVFSVHKRSHTCICQSVFVTFVYRFHSWRISSPLVGTSWRMCKTLVGHRA